MGLLKNDIEVVPKLDPPSLAIGFSSLYTIQLVLFKISETPSSPDGHDVIYLLPLLSITPNQSMGGVSVPNVGYHA